MNNVSQHTQCLSYSLPSLSSSFNFILPLHLMKSLRLSNVEVLTAEMERCMREMMRHGVQRDDLRVTLNSGLLPVGEEHGLDDDGTCAFASIVDWMKHWNGLVEHPLAHDSQSLLSRAFLHEYLEPRHNTRLSTQKAQHAHKCNRSRDTFVSSIPQENAHELQQREDDDSTTAHGESSDVPLLHIDTLFMKRSMIVDLMIFSLLVVCSRDLGIQLPDPRVDETVLRRRLEAAFEVFENKTLVLLIAGASGSGKSAIATRLGQKLSITRNISTDTIRAVSRTHVDRDSMPELFLSTYTAGEALDKEQFNGDTRARIIEGYRRQCAFVESRLEMLIDTYLTKRRDPTVIEGVHLSPEFLNCLQSLDSGNRCIFVPCVLYCPNAANHKLRFARRGGSSITLDPEKNKYIRYFDNIRIIQEYIIDSAEKHDQMLIENKRDEMENAINAIHDLVLDRIVEGGLEEGSD